MRLIPVFLLIGLLFQGCASRLALHQDAVAAYHKGNLPAADQMLSNAVDSKSKNSKDAVCLLLDRATTRFADGDAQGAIADYNKAIEAIDYYNQTSAADTAAQILLQDSAAPYYGDDFEQLLARVYFALVLMYSGDNNNAAALLRQAEEWQQEKNSGYSKSKVCHDIHISPNPFAKYLFATLLEKNRDFSNAAILYEQAATLNPDLRPPAELSTQNATVLVICHNGNAPQKYSATSDASVVSMVALEVILACSNIPPAISSIVGIPVPALWLPPVAYPVPFSVSLDNDTVKLKQAFDVNLAAEDELHQKLPIIAARGAARILTRRAAVGYFQNQDPMLGAFADMGMLVANAMSQADTRSWGTLPCRIDIARFDVSACRRTLKLTMPQNNVYEAKLNLKPGSLCVINVFQIHPGITYVLIPDQFKETP